MKILSAEITHFFQSQGYAIVSTIDKDGAIHNSCKGVVKIDHRGRVYLFDLYKARTYQNLKHNHYISITGVDEHKFSGYCLKGKAKILPKEELKEEIIIAWENKIASRITQRLLKNIREEKGHPRHPEALLPKPEYLIVMEVQDIIDLTPKHIK